MIKSKRICSSVLAQILLLPGFAQQARMADASRRDSVARRGNVELWRDRGNLAELNLLDGPGGKSRGPGTEFKFVKESKSGSSPKFRRRRCRA